MRKWSHGCHNLSTLLKEVLHKTGVKIKVDDSEQRTPGWKFNFWEMKVRLLLSDSIICLFVVCFHLILMASPSQCNRALICDVILVCLLQQLCPYYFMWAVCSYWFIWETNFITLSIFLVESVSLDCLNHQYSWWRNLNLYPNCWIFYWMWSTHFLHFYLFSCVPSTQDFFVISSIHPEMCV